MIQPKKESIDQIINTMQDQIMDLSQEIVEKKCRETYVSTMKNIIYYLMLDLNRTQVTSAHTNKLEDQYGIKPKDQEKLKRAFRQCFNDNFDQLWGAKQ
tara:strand:- start:468 stop:764 length:297 start_codon:yes stop_codon:yes gene_type:complete